MPLPVASAGDNMPDFQFPLSCSLVPDFLTQVEKTLIVRALDLAQNKNAEAALLLKITTKKLASRMSALGLIAKK